MKPILIFLVTFLIVFAGQSANLTDSLLGRLGLDANYFSVGILSLICAALMIGRHKVIIASATLLIILASLPASMTANILDRDYFYALFIAVLIAPHVANRFE